MRAVCTGGNDSPKDDLTSTDNDFTKDLVKLQKDFEVLKEKVKTNECLIHDANKLLIQIKKITKDKGLKKYITSWQTEYTDRFNS